jgi:hypothetical protein
MRHFRFDLRRLLMLGALLSSTTVFAAGSYTQSFSSTPSGWTSAFDTWSVTSGDYRNTNGPSGNTVSWYTGRQWTKNLTYKVRAYSDWPGTGNELGVVFGLTDSTHYFEVLLSVDGQVGVFQVSGNPNAPIARGTGSVNPAAAGLAVDTWFDLDVFVDATNSAKVEVKVNGVDANMINNTITPVAGYIGVVARSNKARFRNASVTSQLFRGNFTQDDGLQSTFPSRTTNARRAMRPRVTTRVTPDFPVWIPRVTVAASVVAEWCRSRCVRRHASLHVARADQRRREIRQRCHRTASGPWRTDDARPASAVTHATARYRFTTAGAARHPSKKHLLGATRPVHAILVGISLWLTDSDDDYGRCPGSS